MTITRRSLKIICLLPTLIAFACKPSQKNNVQLKATNTQTIDTSLIAVLTYDYSNFELFNDYKPAKLLAAENEIIELLLNECVANYNNKQTIKNSALNNKNLLAVSNHKRQYIAVVNRNGEKIVLINFFCEAYGPSWKEQIVLNKEADKLDVCDFRLKINLNTKKYYDLKISGDGQEF